MWTGTRHGGTAVSLGPKKKLHHLARKIPADIVLAKRGEVTVGKGRNQGTYERHRGEKGSRQNKFKEAPETPRAQKLLNQGSTEGDRPMSSVEKWGVGGGGGGNTRRPVTLDQEKRARGWEGKKTTIPFTGGKHKKRGDKGAALN